MTVLRRLGPALLLLWLLWPRAAGAQAPLPADSYRQLLQETAAALQAGAPPTALLDRWEAVTAVSRSDGRVVPLDGAAVADRLAGIPAGQRATLAAEFAAQADALDNWPLPLLDERRGAAAETTLAEILARPEFQVEPDPPNQLRQWLADLLLEALLYFGRLLEGLFGTAGAGRLLTWLLTSVSVLGLLGLLVYVARSLLRDFVRGEGRPDGPAADGTPVTAAAALAEAETLSAGGDYRSAVRFLYLSLLLTLEERGLLRIDRSLTNREYVRSLAARPDLAATLGEVSDVFDRVWYGYQPLSAAAYQRYAEQVAVLRRRRAGEAS